MHCAPKGQLFHIPWHHLGYKVFTCNAPCKGNSKKDYKSMLPCYYVEKIEEVKECA